MPSVPPNPDNILIPRSSPVTTTSNPQSFASVYTGTNANLRSCTSCRRRKVRCNKATPCSNCTKNGLTCIFPPPGRARPTARVRWTEAEQPIREDQAPHLDGGNSASSGQSPPHLLQVPRFQNRELETDASTSARVPLTETYVLSAPSTIDRQSLVRKEPMSGIEQWIERCLYLGERPPKSLYGVGRPSTASAHANNHSSSLTRLTELLIGPPGSSSRDSEEEGEEIDAASDAGSTDTVERLFQSAEGSPDCRAFILGFNLPDNSPRHLHPSPSQIPFYWQTFVENVDPLIKIFHIPSMNKVVREMQRNTRFLSPCKEALVFSIYLAAVTSMTPTEVQELLSREKEALVAQYRLATEKALARAEFLTSPDLMTLQAFVLFLFCMREREHPRFTWTMTALAVRVAEGMGLHEVRRGSGLSPYDTEVSLRLWLSIWLLDLRTALDQGSDFLVPDASSDEGLPLNVNDTDFDSSSIEFPCSRTGMTDMAPTLAKYEIGSLMKKMRRFEAACERSGVQPVTTSEWDDTVQAAALCKSEIESKYLQNCAAGDSFQLFTTLNTRLFFAEVPLLNHDPTFYSDFRSTLPASAIRHLFAASIEAIECSYNVISLSTSPGWARLFRTYVNWNAIFIILEELCIHLNGTDLAQKGWNAIDLALTCCDSSLPSQKHDISWKSLVKLMRKAKWRRDANQPLSERERVETGSDSSNLNMAMLDIWPLSNPGTPSLWSSEYLYESASGGLPVDLGNSPSDAIDKIRMIQEFSSWGLF